MTRLINFCFYLLFFLTPLIWTPINSELFEFNKMLFVHFLRAVILGCWVILMIRNRKLLINRTPLDFFIALFLLANILSTYFSIDVHTSLWGYYSRSNGGLRSTISFILLYYAFISVGPVKNVAKVIRAALFGGLFVSLWAIPEHLGVSYSCLILTGQATASCWVQDVQARVFATLGQPNWLAAYLGMLLFPAIYMFLNANTLFKKFAYALLIIEFYLAFTFTYSRGATIGLIAGLIVMIGYFIWQAQQSAKANYKKALAPFGLVLATLLAINILFGSAITSYKLVNQFAPPSRPAVGLPQAAPSGTQLENGGTESGQIRLIVWKGALQIFKAYPLFGSGVETFGYSYYNFRPKEHNLVSEWEFLYNKAHNEYLNYLATTGIVGFLSYMALIGSFLWWSIKSVLHPSKNLTSSQKLLVVSLAAAYVSYLVQNIFSFSVVILALLFYLIPAWAFAATDSLTPVNLNFKFPLFKSVFLRRLAMILVAIFTFLVIRDQWHVWMADTYYALGSHANESGNPVKGYSNLIQAVKLNDREPLYYSELGYSEAGTATLEADHDATLAAQLKTLADNDTKKALQISPKNLSIARTAIRTYYLLTTIDPSYNAITLQTLDQAIALAPTDPKLPYNKALVLQQINESSPSAQNLDQALQELQKALDLKPNYREARLALADLYHQLKDNDKAIEQLQIVLRLIPNDPEAVDRLNSWQKP